MIDDPTIEKTSLMLNVEEAYQGMDIRQVLLAEIIAHRTDDAALASIAARLKRPMNPSLLSIWVRRLGILREVRAARASRR